MREYTLEFLTTKAEAMLDYLAKPLPKNDTIDFHNELFKNQM